MKPGSIRSPMHLLQLILIALIASYAGLALFALFFADAMLFPAPESSYRENEAILWLRGKDGARIAAVWLESPDAQATILYCHGNAEDLGMIMPEIENLREMGANVLAFDYPGYGLSDGAPDEPGIHAAAEAAWEELASTRGIDPDSIILYGRSLGGGPAVQIASTRACGGLILHSAFASAFRVISRIRLLPWDRFNNLSKIDKVACPKLIIHGTADRVVPFSHARMLIDKATSPTSSLFAEGAGHNNITDFAHDAYRSAVSDFLIQTSRRHAEKSAHHTN